MKRSLVNIVTVAVTMLALFQVGCGDSFTEPMVLGGKEVSADVLNLGEETYTLYCRACHGVNGDGNGPAAKGLRPPPRDFRDGIYKFVAVESGYLPNDEDFVRIIRHGLDGTAMLPWDISDQRLDAVIQYIKTFAEVWSDEDEEIGEPIVPDNDPFGDAQRAEAVDRGKKLYHALAQCNSCHPSYATYQEIYEAGMELTGFGRDDLDAKAYETELKDSDYQTMLAPPDFTYHKMRAGSDVQSIFRSIASGIGGTAMPTWKNALEDEDIWAMAYYVESLVAIRGTSQAMAMKESLRNQSPFTAPAEDGDSEE